MEAKEGTYEEGLEAAEMRDEQRFLDEAYASGVRAGRDKVIHEILYGVAFRDLLPREVNTLLGYRPEDPHGMALIVRITEEFKVVLMKQQALNGSGRSGAGDTTTHAARAAEDLDDE